MSFRSFRASAMRSSGRIVELRAEDDADGVAHRQHAADATGDRPRHFRRLEYRAPADRQQPVADRVSAVLHIGAVDVGEVVVPAADGRGRAACCGPRRCFPAAMRWPVAGSSGVSSPVSVGSRSRYIVPSSRIVPSIISG